MITKIKTYNMVLGLALATLTFVACSDTWDDHYENLGDSSTGMHDGTLWQAISSDPDLSNFARVLEECNVKPALDGSQVFTVFAPTNAKLSAAEADQLIADYKEQAKTVLQANNTVLKEFIHNHMSLYNHSFSDLRVDTLVLMNGKYAILDRDATISGVKMTKFNQLYSNGVLNVLSDKITYLPNVFESFRKDEEYDSIYSFLYNSHFYYKVFMPSQSVPGSIVDGKMQYLDSVFSQRNELFSYLGQINSEDSSYIMTAPTNEVWKDLVEEYEPYFDYPEKYDQRDSMVYTMPRLAIVNGTTFSRTFNSAKALNDSAMSNSAAKNYNDRKFYWDVPFEYYQYYKPLDAKGALNQTEIMACSNGEVRKAREWNIDKRMTFHKYILSGPDALKEVSKTKEKDDSVNTVTINRVQVSSDNVAFYNKLWDNYYLEFQPNYATLNNSVYYTLSNVLSNIGYDIYLVCAPAAAANNSSKTASEDEKLPTLLRCTLKAPGMSDVVMDNQNDPHYKKGTYETSRDSVDYILLAEDFKFPKCTYGVADESLQAVMQIETRVSSVQLRNKTYSRVMRINCVLLVPHGSLEVVGSLPGSVGEGDKKTIIPASAQGQPGVLLYPHGKYDDRDYKAWYMLR